MDSSHHFLHYLEKTVGCTDLQPLTKHLKNAICSCINAPLVAIYTQRTEQYCQTITSPKICDLFLYQQPQHFLGYKAMQQGKPQFQLLQNYENPEAASQLMELGCQSALCLPVMDEEKKPIAAVSIFLSSSDSVTEEQQDFLWHLVGYLCPQLQHIFAHQRLQVDLNHRLYSEHNLDLLFQRSSNFICVLDNNGYFLQVNPALENMLGYPKEELINRHICSFAHADDRAYLTYLLSHIQAHNTIHRYCHRYITNNGKTVIVEFSAQYLPESNLTISSARDITDQREMEKRNSELERCVSLEQTKAAFFANVSHGLKTPLNVMQSSTEVLRLKLMHEYSELYEQEFAKFFDYIHQNSLRLLRLINNLLDYSKLGTNNLHLHPTLYRIDDYIHSIAELTQDYAEAVNCTLSIQGTLSQPSNYYFDLDKLDRILLNLLSNSLKNSSKGGKVAIKLSETSSHIMVEVIDNGAGISEELLPQVFKGMQPTGNPLIKAMDGTGLGLSIAKSLVELHGGTIQAESSLNETTNITFTISKSLCPSSGGSFLTAPQTPGISCISTPDMRKSRVQIEMSDLSAAPKRD